MSTSLDKLSKLSPEQRALLALKAKQQKMKGTANASIVKQPRREGINFFPLSFAQQRVMFYEEYMPGTYRYHFSNAYRMKGKLNVEALRRAMNALVQRHEIMRSFVAYENDDYIQFIRPELYIELPVIEMNNEDQLFERMEKDTKTPYDFMNGPLVKANLFRLAEDEDEHVLVWLTHHLISDGGSVTIFEEDLASLYRSIV